MENKNVNGSKNNSESNIDSTVIVNNPNTLIPITPTEEQPKIKKTKFQTFTYKVQKNKFVNFTTKKITPILWPYIIMAAFLIIIPMVLISLYAVIVPTGDSINFKISFENFVNFFTTSSFLISLLMTIALSLSATIIAILIAYPVAYIMSCMSSKFATQNIWILVTTPIWINMILKMIGLETLFKVIAPSLLGTSFSVVIGMVYAFVPFVILPIYSSLERVDKKLIDASKDLGASNTKTFWKITFRESVPGIISGFVIMFVQAATSLVVVQFMGEGKINLLVEIIESYFFKGVNYGMGATISVIFALILSLIIFVSYLWKKRFDRPKLNKKREVKLNEKILEI